MADIVQTLAFPVRLANNRIVTTDQASPADVQGQIHVMILTPPGWLDREPYDDFGLYDQAHLSGGADIAEVERQISEHVPDAVAAVSEDPAALNPALSLLRVQIGG